MSMSYERIVEACRSILEAIEFHVTETRRERRFITAYQIWPLLKEQEHPICEQLIAECGGDFVGKKAGSNVGPAQKIAQALGHCRDIETHYLDNRGITFYGIEPSGPDCGLFRLRD